MKETGECKSIALWKLIKSGDEQAFCTLISSYRPKLLVVSYHVLGNFQESEDVIQDVFLRLWRRKASLIMLNSLDQYLTRAVKNASLTRLTRRKLTAEKYSEYCYNQPNFAFNNRLENAELGLIIMQAIDSLPSLQRKTFTAAYLDGKSHLEIVQEENIALSTVRNNISNALKNLRNKLTPLKKH